MSLVKVPGTPFVRDTQSMAIINTDTTAKEEYLAKSRILNGQKEQINKMNAEINGLRNELGDIKQLLQQLIDKK
jgi:hypothetical protein